MSRPVRTIALIGTLFVLVIGLTVAPVGLAFAQETTRGEPDLSVYVPDNQLSPGTAGEAATLEFMVQNDAELDSGSMRERVTTARSVEFSIDDAGPFEVQTGTTPIGSVQEGVPTSVPMQFEVPADLEPGEYEITVELKYSYSDRVSDFISSSETTTTVTKDVTVEVRDDLTFAIVDVESDVMAGGTGTLQATIEHIGEGPANNTHGTLSPVGESIALDGSVANLHLGDLEPGDRTEVSVDVQPDPAASPGAKPIELALSYEDDDGIERQALPRTTAVNVLEPPTIEIDDVDATVAVGYDGEITGTITNHGPGTLDGAVLVAAPQTDSLSISDTRYALPSLEPGESTEFNYRTDVSGQADAGPRDVQFFVEYPAGDSTVEDGPHSARVVIGDAVDEFSIEAIQGSVPIGGETEVILQITNERPETVYNIDGILYTERPLSATNDEAFVAELGPGESAEMTFVLAAEDDALAEPRPVELDFQYRTEHGSTELSDAYTVGIDLVDADNPDDGNGVASLGTILTAIVVLTLGAGGFVAARRYR